MLHDRRAFGWMLSILLFGLFICAAAPALAEAPWLRLPLNGEGPKIVDAEGEEVGRHHPVTIRDQDDPESRDPDRYRVEGRYDGGLRYYAEDRSFSRIEKGLSFDGPIEAIAMSVEVKLALDGNNRFACLLSTKSNSDKAGFALYLWGNQVHFRFSDGKKRYKVVANGKAVRDGEWHTIEAAFDSGKAAIWIDGVRQTTQDVEALTIAEPKRPLHLGGYPINNKGRRQYAFDGWLDEVGFGKLRNSLRKALDEATAGRSNQPPPPKMTMTAQPIDGNEPHFGGERVFHTFHGHPTPLTFLFNPNPTRLDEGDDPALALYVPKGVSVAAAHQSNHNEQPGTIEMKTQTVEKDGRTWTRHETTGIDLVQGTRGRIGWKRGPFVSVGFEPDEGVNEAPIRYGLVIGGEEQDLKEATVRFLDPPEPVTEDERGSFHNFGYFIMPAYAYPQKPLQQSMADLLKSVGLTGKGRFYGHGDFRSEFDEFLKDEGFTLYEIALWSGPKAYEMAADPEGTTEAYVERVAHHFKPNGMNEGVMFDVEPWRMTYKKASFEPEIRRSYARWAGLDDVPTYAELRQQRASRKWIEFWLHNTAMRYRAMSKAVRENHPDPEALRIAYTYFFPYDDEQRLWRRFRSIPKDPRLSEQHYDVHLMSLYHTNDRELVDQTRLSRKHLDKPIWGMSSVSRVNPIQSGFTSPDESLSPRRLEQKAVLCAALGMERHGIWPGRGWLDGRHLAIGRASRFVWARENFYFDGERITPDVSVVSHEQFSARHWAYTAHRDARGRILTTLFNFADRPARFTVRDPAGESEVELAPRAYDVVLHSP